MVVSFDLSQLPATHKEEVQQAVIILQAAGCQEIYLFGSLPEGHAQAASDIDIAIRGLPPRKFFPTYGKLMHALTHRVDLVNLDTQIRFARFLERTQSLVRVA